MYSLSIQGSNDASVCLMQDTKIIWYAEEKKILGDKQYVYFPFKSLEKLSTIFKEEIDFVYFTSYNYTDEEINHLRGFLYYLGIKYKNYPFCYYMPHHLSHAFKSFTDSGFKEARVFVVDGRGSYWRLNNFNRGFETTSVYDFKKNYINCIYKNIYVFNKEDEKYTVDKKLNYGFNITGIKNTKFNVSNNVDLGHFYGEVSEHFGYRNEEGKFMGFQSYGKPFDIGESFNSDQIKNLDKTQDVAASCQRLFEKKYQRLVEKYKSKNMVFTGGTALNVVNNYKLEKKFEDCNLWFDPLCGDAGNSIGKSYMGIILRNNLQIDSLKNIYLGTKINKFDCSLKDNEQIKKVNLKDIIKLLTEGEVVGLIQGKSEAGPRALGNRSLLLDPTLNNAKEKMNSIKKRENFRPFACAILENYVSYYFDVGKIKRSPFMMHAPQAKDFAKKTIPSIIHVDNTCRIQTVNKNDNKVLYNILQMFKIPVIMNTSFNLRGYPIAEDLNQVLFTFRNSDLNYVYFSDFNLLLSKKNVL